MSQGMDILQGQLGTGSGTYDATGIYGYLRSIEPQDAVKYVGIGALFLAFLVRVVKLNTTVIACMLITAGVLYLMNESTRQETASYNQQMDYKIRALDELTGVRHPYVYTNPDLVDFFAQHSDLRRFAPTSFDTALLRCDMLLKIKYDLAHGGQRCKANIDVANDLKNKALTSLWEHQFNVPGAALYAARLEKAIVRLQLLLSACIAEMLQGCDGLYDATSYSTPTADQASDKLGSF